MFGDEGFGVGGGAGEGGEGAGIAGVAQGDADVAEEAAAFGAEDGGVGEVLFETGGVEGEECEEVGGGEVGAGVGAQEGGGAGEAVPGAGGEAVVAAVDAGAEGAAEFEGDGAFEFDGVVGEAAAGIKLEGGGDGLGGAGGEAAGAGAAAVFFGSVGFEFEGGEDFGEEEPVAEGAADEVGVFADEAEAGALGEVAFEDGAGIDVPEGAGAGSAEVVEVGGELAEGGGEEVVVVGVAGVAGDCAGEALRHRGTEALRRGGEVGGGGVAGGEAEDGAGTGEDLGGVDAFVGVAGEPGHFAVLVGFEPAGQVRGGGGRGGGGDVAEVEAEGEGALAEGGFHAPRGWPQRTQRDAKRGRGGSLFCLCVFLISAVFCRVLGWRVRGFSKHRRDWKGAERGVGI